MTISNLPRIWCHIFTECVGNGTSFRCASERKEVPNHPPLISMTLTSLVYSPRALLTDPEFSFSTTQPSKDKDTLSINHHLRIHYQNLRPSLPQAISRKMFCFTGVGIELPANVCWSPQTPALLTNEEGQAFKFPPH